MLHIRTKGLSVEALEKLAECLGREIATRKVKRATKRKGTKPIVRMSNGGF